MLQIHDTLKSILNSPANIVITTHQSPDGDAIGSSLGLMHFLLQMKHKVNVIVPDAYPPFLQWMPGNNTIINFSDQPNIAQKYISESTIIFCLDFNALSRIKQLGDFIQKSSSSKILIDHHRQPENFAAYSYVDINACSTSQLIYEFIASMEKIDLINKHIATCLYAGILTDTGSFRFPSTTADTLRIAAHLIECGAENALIYDSIYDNYSENRLRLLGYTLQHKMEVYKESGAALICLSNNELNQFAFTKGDTEGIVNYPLSIEGIKLSVLVLEKDGVIKLSLRSKGKFSVNDMARKHFTGGGHTNAAGAISTLSYNETIQLLKNLFKQYAEEILK
ncbi:MAG: bifunctional oligoribonuclease/PAP phosphatase NrnA [Bacteroidetes bacterium]|jgi:phosphoesterase RecJ-like protein|nr:bifunctional oligoribonuclease/PAP phosphatase NrnA [Bacteroidota bacterium]MBV6460253.1 putative bifunctional oligoribonuclease and PAP phosphatase NrnA [Flavobacteriales bacterium]WKZ74621.1 MAG: bifunctional oligoribonuclease/PAP phosphatase NrnA [Vicingaceae bacterium]MCL4816835.1 bifunctional oligoribonuclease/PAP phosphatase NrnA [Flavobacteriales bacterium]NOG94928.1 bifunctional oligoribonuclease/PAP phosphatase NrnA [Bacteroidota bacterium]